MVPFRKSVVLFLLVTVTLNGGKALPPINPKVTVQIINNLNPPQDLTFHCKSKDDDLGEQTLRGGQKYEFRFRPSVVVFITTLFFCNFRWPSDTSLHHFNIYEENRDINKCLVCSWKITEKGPCKYDSNSHDYTNCYPWISNPQFTALTSLNSTTASDPINSNT